MSNLIGIVNYGVVGNIYNIRKAVKVAEGESFLVESLSDFKKADKLILPGVGSFKDAMEELERKGFVKPIKEFNKPILGICLGMQILADVGFEYGKTKGLGLIQAEVKPIICDSQIPHMGYNTLEVLESNPILEGIENEEFYFMHSFEVVNYNNISALTTYADHKFVSVLCNDNVYGVQFHPEKSRQQGIKLFNNFINLSND